MNKVNTNISFSSDEKEVVSIIREVINKYSRETQAYIVGGFVRDKLLGKSPNDIDIMVYPISAEKFAMLITNHLNLKNPHVIKENPEKSKNISTCKIFIPLSSGKIEEIDIAQSRKDVYSSDSRNPKVEVATPSEDATRRDLTINSIFYDIVNGKIVDFTGMGIKDLISNTIRTPLDPLKTFKEDPLRIFRTIRFAAKYKGKIDAETYSAMQNPELKAEIRQKISKERVGEEIKKMFGNPNAEVAIELLKNTGLLDDIMSEALKGTKYEGKMAPLEMDQDNPNHKLNWWNHTFQVITNTLQKLPQYEGEKRVTMVLAALTHDMGKLFNEIRIKKPGTDKHPGHEKGFTSYVGHEEESYEIVQHILKYLKLEPFVQQVAGLARYHMLPHSLSRDNSGDKALRKFIRKMGELSLSWLDVLNLSIADAYSKDINISPETIKEYKELEQRLQTAMASLSPEANPSTKIKPILDGNEIMTILGIKPGPHMKEMGEFIKDLMDENPNISKEEATLKLKEKFQTSQPIKAQASTDNTCSIHILQQKMMELQDLLDEDKTYEAMSVMNSLKDKFGDDEKITRLIAINTFRSLIKDSKTKDNNLLQYVFDKATENFFDSILNAYAFGILMLNKTSTSDDVLREVGSRVLKMSPGTLRFVIDMLPQDQIVNKDAVNFIKGELSENKQRK